MLRSLARKFRPVVAADDLLCNRVKFYSVGFCSGGGGGGGGRKLKPIADDLLFKRVKLYSTGFGSGCLGGGGRLEGKVALITGGASGLGKATAQEFIKHGAQVIIADIDTNLGSEVAANLGTNAHYVYCNVAEESTVAEAVDTAINRHGKLDIMFNNAGISGTITPPSIDNLDLNEIDRVMQINVRGTLAGIKHAARVMIPKESGSILCTSSVTGVIGTLGNYQYAISKFTVCGIVKSMVCELCRNGIRINCISPAPIPTPLVLRGLGMFYPGATEEQVAKIVNGLSELKGAKCEEIDIANAALYLASDEAKFITGQNLVVDGGFTSFKNLEFPSPDKLVFD